MSVLTVPAMLEARVAATPDKPFLYFGDGAWTYARFAAEVGKTAQGMRSLGVEPGAQVVLFLPNSPELLFVWFALAYLRAVAVPINTAFQASEVVYPLAHSEPSLVVAAEGLRETLQEALAGSRIGTCPVVWVGAGGLDLGASGGERPDPRAASAEDVACFNAQAYSTMGAVAAGGSLVLLERFRRRPNDLQRAGARGDLPGVRGAVRRRPGAGLRHERVHLRARPAPRRSPEARGDGTPARAAGARDPQRRTGRRRGGALPKTPTQKVQKRVLRDSYTRMGSAPGA